MSAKRLVQFSTGAGSAEVAWRVVAEHGAASVVLLTADTLVEDADNWRFAREVVARLGCEWTILTDGRTPMQVGRDHRVVPNNRMAVCSRVLKRDLIRKHMDATYDPADSVVYLGFDWTEPERHDRSVAHWAPWTIESPLIAPPYVSKPDLLDLFRSRGIEPPALYAQGFTHANCGGGCVRGGQAQWALKLRVDRSGYLEWEREEEVSRAMLGKDVSILRDRSRAEVLAHLGLTQRDLAWVVETECLNCGLSEHGANEIDDCPGFVPQRTQSQVVASTGAPLPTVVPLTLTRFRRRIEAEPTLFDADDWGACGCTDDFGGVA